MNTSTPAAPLKREALRKSPVPHSAATSAYFAGVPLGMLKHHIFIPGEGWVKIAELVEQFDKATADFFRGRQLRAAGLCKGGAAAA